MKSILKKCIQGGRGVSISKRRPQRGAVLRSRSLRFEALQDRVVMAASLDWVLPIANTPDQLPYSQYVQDVAADSAGNSYVAGDFTGTVDFDPGNTHGDNADILNPGPTNSAGFLAKYSPSGEFLWVTRVDGSAERVALDTAGDAYVAGGAITKIGGAAGTVLGSPIAVGADVDWYATDIAVGSGSVYVTSANQVSRTFALARYSADFAGSPVSVWRYELAAGTHAVAVDGVGNAYVTGSFSGTVDFDPGPGTYSITGGGMNRTSTYVMKITPEKSLGWVGEFKPLARWSHVSGDAIALDGSGNVYVGGWYQGSIDFDPGKATFKLGDGQGFITKLSPAGKFVWGKSFGAAIDDLAVDGSGSVYGAGNFNAAADFDPGPGVFMLPADYGDLFVVKLSSAGDFQWAVAAGGTGMGWVNGLAVTGSGKVYIGGFFDGQLDFDPGASIQLLDSSGEDGFVWSLVQ